MNTEQKFPNEEPSTAEEVVAEILASWSMSEPDEIRAAVQLLEAREVLDADEATKLIATGKALISRKLSATPPAKKRGRPKKAE